MGVIRDHLQVALLSIPKSQQQSFTLKVHTKGLGWLPLTTVSPELIRCLASRMHLVSISCMNR